MIPADHGKKTLTLGRIHHLPPPLGPSALFTTTLQQLEGTVSEERRGAGTITG